MVFLYCEILNNFFNNNYDKSLVSITNKLLVALKNFYELFTLIIIENTWEGIKTKIYPMQLIVIIN